MKLCKYCDKKKDPEEFPKNRARPDGRDSRCKMCWSDYSKQKRSSKWRGSSAKSTKKNTVLLLKEEVLPKSISRFDIVKVANLPKEKGLFEWCNQSLLDGVNKYKSMFGILPNMVWSIQATKVFPYRYFMGRD